MEISEDKSLYDDDRLNKPMAHNRATFYPTKKPDFNEYWPRIKGVLCRVINAEACSRVQWDDCFFDIYALCTSTHHNTVQLYTSLARFYIEIVENILARLVSLEAIDLVESYASSWQKFNNGAYHIHELCNYLNRMMKRDFSWKLFCRDNEELAKQIGEVSSQMALSRIIWQKWLLVPLRDKLYTVIWNEFEKVRIDKYVTDPSPSVRHCLQSFIDVCFPSDQERANLMNSIESGNYMTNRTPSPERLKFYEEFFERRFLEDTEQFFKRSPVVHDQSQSMYEKMAASSSILASEEHLCKSILFLPTVEKSLESLRALFVLGPMDRYTSVLPEYVRNEMKSELNLAFKLLSPFRERGLTYLIQEYEKHVEKTLMDQLEPTNLTPASFVEIICQKHQYFTKFADEVFEGSYDMNDGYRRAVESVVNKIGNEPFYAAKMIARHMDLLLKRSSRSKGNNDDLEDKMDDAITVFRFIKDKDAFLKIYQRQFSIRLLSKLFCSLQTESLMIEKLKGACGNDYTNKLVRMYTDYDNSRQLTESFQQEKKCDCSHNEDEVTVVQTCAWPVVSSKDDHNFAGFKISPSLSSYTRCFKEFYEAKYTGRILNFSYHVSTADVIISVGTRQSVVTMTVPQAVILLNYNSEDSLAINSLVEASGLTFEYVCSCLRALLDFKILKTEQANRNFNTPETTICLNPEFNAPRTRIHLPPPPSVSRTQDTSNIVPTQKETIQDRKAVVECIVVRIMKTKKVLKHHQLVEYVLSITKDRFVPPMTLVKTCIEGLIEKHFIQRTGLDSYEYLA